MDNVYQNEWIKETNRNVAMLKDSVDNAQIENVKLSVDIKNLSWKINLVLVMVVVVMLLSTNQNISIIMYILKILGG